MQKNDKLIIDLTKVITILFINGYGCNTWIPFTPIACEFLVTYSGYHSDIIAEAIPKESHSNVSANLHENYYNYVPLVNKANSCVIITAITYVFPVDILGTIPVYAGKQLQQRNKRLPPSRNLDLMFIHYSIF